MLKGGVLPAGGRLGAADIPAPAGPGGGGPAASAQPPCPRCKQSLTGQQGAHDQAPCRLFTFSQLLPQNESLCCPVTWHKYTGKLMAAFVYKTNSGFVVQADHDLLHDLLLTVIWSESLSVVYIKAGK